MKKEPFHQPRVALNRVYTRQGDGGQTRLAGGQVVSKDSPRLECYGTIDELNAVVGMARATTGELTGRASRLGELSAILDRLQQELFNLGSMLATRRQDLRPSQARVSEGEVRQLEREIDAMTAALPSLRSFVLPGGNRLNAELHLCRTICRRAERRVVTLAREEDVPPTAIKYLNRLSDAFFVWSRWASAVLGSEEMLWDPNQPAAAREPAD